MIFTRGYGAVQRTLHAARDAAGVAYSAVKQTAIWSLALKAIAAVPVQVPTPVAPPAAPGLKEQSGVSVIVPPPPRVVGAAYFMTRNPQDENGPGGTDNEACTSTWLHELPAGTSMADRSLGVLDE